tara:strand:+ start:1622 stop:2164 length:543 start_codon:yes stop_codon:yes gene_type:complete
MATTTSIKSSGQGRIRATARLPEIDAYIRKVNKSLRPLSPTEIQVMRQEGAAQLRVIKMNWPVRTGTSRAGWAFSVVGRMGQVAIIFENPVHYSAWIVHKGSTTDEPWFQKLLPAVWKAGKPRLIARLKKEIDKTQLEIAKLQSQGETKRRAILQAGQGKPIGASGSAAQRFKDALRQVL